MDELNEDEFRLVRKAFATWLNERDNPARQLLSDLALVAGVSESSMAIALEGVAISTWFRTARVYRDGPIFRVKGTQKNEAVTTH